FEVSFIKLQAGASAGTRHNRQKKSLYHEAASSYKRPSSLYAPGIGFSTGRAMDKMKGRGTSMKWMSCGLLLCFLAVESAVDAALYCAIQADFSKLPEKAGRRGAVPASCASGMDGIAARFRVLCERRRAGGKFPGRAEPGNL